MPATALPLATPLPTHWTKAEAAQVCRVTPRTINSWIARGIFPRPRRVGGRVLWDPQEVMRFLENSAAGKAEEAPEEHAPAAACG
jgi:predicted DNA-binding transcriptional regulator AlpA